jgi:hypothetical protein
MSDFYKSPDGVHSGGSKPKHSTPSLRPSYSAHMDGDERTTLVILQDREMGPLGKGLCLLLAASTPAASMYYADKTGGDNTLLGVCGIILSLVCALPNLFSAYIVVPGLIAKDYSLGIRLRAITGGVLLVLCIQVALWIAEPSSVHACLLSAVIGQSISSVIILFLDLFVSPFKRWQSY